MDLIVTKPIFLILTAAVAYAVATAGIKMASYFISAPALILIVIGFGLATAAEIVLLRQAELGVIYIAIVTVETLLVLALAAVIGEGLNFKQMFGAGLVLTGIVFVGE